MFLTFLCRAQAGNTDRCLVIRILVMDSTVADFSLAAGLVSTNRGHIPVDVYLKIRFLIDGPGVEYALVVSPDVCLCFHAVTKNGLLPSTVERIGVAVAPLPYAYLEPLNCGGSVVTPQGAIKLGD